MKLKILKNLDFKIAIIGLIFSAIVLVGLIYKHFHPIYIVADGVGFIAILTYLLMRHKLLYVERENPNLSLIFSGIGMVFTVLALIAWEFRPSEYIKPLDYYILVSMGISFIFISIVYFKQKWLQYVLLVLICAIGLMHIWTESMMFPGLIGEDPYTHMKTTLYSLSVAGINGNPPLTILNMGGSYSLMDVYLREMINIFHLDYRLTALIFWGSFQTVGIIILIYLIGRELFNHKIGLVASLVVANANWVIFWGYWIIPNGMGAMFSLLIVYLFIKAYKTKRIWIAFFSIPILFMSFITNPIVAIWSIGTIVCSAIPFLFKNLKTYKYVYTLPAIAVIAGFVWFGLLPMKNALAQSISDNAAPYYLMGSSSLPYSTQSVNKNSLSYGVTNINPTTSNYVNYLGRSYWGEMLINTIGMIVYFGIAIIGIFIFLKHSVLHKTWVILCIGVLLMSIIPQMMGVSVIEHRWLYLVEVLIAIPLAVALLRLINLKYAIPITALLVGLIAFFSIIGLPDNQTNRDLSLNQIATYAFTQKELDGLSIVENYHPRIIGTDPLYEGMMMSNPNYIDGENIISLQNNLLTANFIDCKADVLLLREDLAQVPIAWGSGAVYRLKYNPIEKAEQQGYKEVWNNGEIYCLVK